VTVELTQEQEAEQAERPVAKEGIPVVGVVAEQSEVTAPVCQLAAAVVAVGLVAVAVAEQTARTVQGAVVQVMSWVD